MPVLNAFLMVIMAALNVVSAFLFFGGGLPIMGIICVGMFLVCCWLAFTTIEEDF